MNLETWLSMGGYGAYVWSAYGITFIVFILNIGLIFREMRKIKKTIKQFLVDEV